MKHGYKGATQDITHAHDKYRQVVYTGEHMQLVVMTIAPHDEIGSEVHEDRDQLFHLTEGEATLVINGEEQKLLVGDIAIVPGGAEHNLMNISSDEPVKLYTVYAPPEHEDGLVEDAKTEADSNDEECTGTTTEQ